MPSTSISILLECRIRKFLFIQPLCLWKSKLMSTVFVCDFKRDHIFTQVLRVDKENAVKPKLGKNIILYWGKWSNVTHLWVAKVCESQRLAVNLKSGFSIMRQKSLWMLSSHKDLFTKQGPSKVLSSQHVCASVSWHGQSSCASSSSMNVCTCCLAMDPHAIQGNQCSWYRLRTHHDPKQDKVIYINVWSCC